jgi:hypothetical protein
MNTSGRFSLLTCLVQMTIVLLMLLLVWFEIVPAQSERDAQSIVNAGFQRERSRLFVNSVYALCYRSHAEKAQAMSDLQITLPLFQDEQALLATNPDPAVQRLVQQARPDYLALVSAVHILIAHPNEPVNQDELAVVLFHDQRFFLPMDALTTVLQQHAERQTEQFLLVKGIIEGACVIIALFWLIIDRSPKV